MYTFEKLIGLGVVGAFAFTAYKAIKADMVLSKLDVAVDGLSDNIVVDVKDKLVEEAVNRAVDRAVAKEVSYVARDTVTYRNKEISAQISDAIECCLDDIASDVKEAAMEKARNIDLSKIRKEVTEDLREIAEEKLEDDMDDILEDYKSHLRNVDTVYESIADALAGRDRKETVLRLG